MHRKEMARILLTMAEERHNDADELEQLAAIIIGEPDAYEPNPPPTPTASEPQGSMLIRGGVRLEDVTTGYPYGPAMKGNPEAIKEHVRRDLARSTPVKVEWSPDVWVIYLPGDEV
jgi:hypothetical protein